MGLYFALADDGLMYNLCDCGDFDAAEESATDLGINAIWLADEQAARQWQKRLNDGLGIEPETCDYCGRKNGEGDR